MIGTPCDNRFAAVAKGVGERPDPIGVGLTPLGRTVGEMNGEGDGVDSVSAYNTIV